NMMIKKVGNMGIRVSKIYGMDIYTDSGKYLGRVQDILIDMEQGKIIRLTMEPLANISKEEAKRILREKSVLYTSVKNVEDVVVVGSKTTGLSPNY
ncbi:MAG: PRC-barrel domain-containing protein, partial [Candidatus Anstonellaceae archaeon]